MIVIWALFIACQLRAFRQVEQSMVVVGWNSSNNSSTGRSSNNSSVSRSSDNSSMGTKEPTQQSYATADYVRGNCPDTGTKAEQEAQRMEAVYQQKLETAKQEASDD